MTPNEPAEFDRAMADRILHYGVMAADMELLCPGPASTVPGPDGSVQPEMPADRTRRIARAAVLHLLEQGLLVIADDARERMERGIPVWQGPRT
jgi:hypothetical protein